MHANFSNEEKENQSGNIPAGMLFNPTQTVRELFWLDVILLNKNCKGNYFDWILFLKLCYFEKKVWGQILWCVNGRKLMGQGLFLISFFYVFLLELDWISEFKKKQEVDEKNQKIKVKFFSVFHQTTEARHWIFNWNYF